MQKRALYRRIFHQELDPILQKKITSHTLCPGKDIPLEWWYFTGHLESKNRNGKTKRFGYEFCLFKIHPATVHVGPFFLSMLRKKPYLMFHFALTNKTTGKFETFQDTCLLHSDFSSNKVDLRLHDTHLQYQKKFSLKTKNPLAELSLTLTPQKKLVKHFESGFATLYPHQRTYYLSFTRLKTSGHIKLRGKNYKVVGSSWFDHQKTNAYTHGSLLGWDWFSIMLNDKSEIMLYTLRDHRGLNSHYLGGSYILPNGKVLPLHQGDFTVEKMGSWKSPHSQIVYPSGWQINIPKHDIKVHVTPCVQDQELHSTIPFAYWEGACDVTGKKKGRKINGQAYVELVGYDKRLRVKILRLLSGNF